MQYSGNLFSNSFAFFDLNIIIGVKTLPEEVIAAIIVALLYFPMMIIYIIWPFILKII